MNVDRYIELVKNRQFLKENDMRRVLVKAREILAEEANVVRLASPVVVCGDIHGQLDVAGEMPKKNYIFMGDFVDRGFHSLETITLLFLLKLKYPRQITLLRGNHESRQITQIYGFHDEVVRKYGRPYIWKLCCECFDFLALAATIDEKIFCVHAGLSPDLRTIDQIRLLTRKREIPTFGPFADLMWSDPEDIETWNISSRGSGWLFGSRVTREFNHINGLRLICRSHQTIQKGFKYHFKEKSLATVWSAPNYNYKMGNVASVFDFDEKLEVDIKTFKENKEVHSNIVAEQHKRPMYFL